MKTLTKTQYEMIAKPFADVLKWHQYLYASQGFDKATGNHNKRGMDFWDEFHVMERIVFPIANSLADANSKFDRDKFLETAGMQSDGRRGWSFVPTSEYIKRVQR
jgi:hypothetical protein